MLPVLDIMTGRKECCQTNKPLFGIDEDFAIRSTGSMASLPQITRGRTQGLVQAIGKLCQPAERELDWTHQWIVGLGKSISRDRLDFLGMRDTTLQQFWV